MIGLFLFVPAPAPAQHPRNVYVILLESFWDVHFINSAPDKVELCTETEESPTCKASTAWLDQLLTVGIDIFQGKQHSLPVSDGLSELAKVTTMIVEKDTEQLVR